MAQTNVPFTEDTLKTERVTARHVHQMASLFNKTPADANRHHAKFFGELGLPENQPNPLLAILGKMEWYDLYQEALNRWISKEGSKATFGVVFKALDSIGWTDAKVGILGLSLEGLSNLDVVDGNFGGQATLALENSCPLVPFKPIGGERQDPRRYPKLDIKIQLPTDARGTMQNNEYYQCKQRPRGRALIINNEFKGQGEDERNGSNIDFNYMGTVLGLLGYDVSVAYNVRSEDLAGVFQRFRMSLTQEMDSCIVVVMSHGDLTRVQMEGDGIVSIYRDIVYELDHKKCSVMKGKPKIFIFQACQDFWGLPKRKDPVKVPLDIGDVLVALPGAPGEGAYRDPNYGSQYIYAVTKTLMGKAADSDVRKIFHDEVVETMAKMQEHLPGVFRPNETQIPTATSIGGFKNFYFNPHLFADSKN